MDHGFTIRVAVPFAEAVARVRDALKAQGFGVLTEIDVQATLQLWCVPGPDPSGDVVAERLGARQAGRGKQRSASKSSGSPVGPSSMWSGRAASRSRASYR